ncbi:hypothetical protein H0H92_000111 [Tricholoma furcatifolium]|nr:hypothetical protein H0H92_000111 [Tricholoma furcatifolium]
MSRHLQWPQEWIDTAKKIVQQMYNEEYHRDIQDFEPTASSTLTKISDNIFDNMHCFKSQKPSTLQDELDHYLNAEVEEVDNVIEWWIQRIYGTDYLHRALALAYASETGAVWLVKDKDFLKCGPFDDGDSDGEVNVPLDILDDTDNED